MPPPQGALQNFRLGFNGEGFCPPQAFSLVFDEMALSKKHRLNGKDFERVLRKGKTVKNSFFFIRFLENKIGRGRVAVSVTMKVAKKSTTRNYLRRIMIGTVGASGLLKKPLDIIFVATPRIVGKSFGEIKSGLIKAINILLVNDILPKSGE